MASTQLKIVECVGQEYVEDALRLGYAAFA